MLTGSPPLPQGAAVGIRPSLREAGQNGSLRGGLRRCTRASLAGGAAAIRRGRAQRNAPRRSWLNLPDIVTALAVPIVLAQFFGLISEELINGRLGPRKRGVLVLVEQDDSSW